MMLVWIALHLSSNIGPEAGSDHDEIAQSIPNGTVRTQSVPVLGSVVQSLIRMAF